MATLSSWLPLLPRLVKANHDPAPVPLRRNHDAAGQSEWPAEQAGVGDRGLTIGPPVSHRAPGVPGGGDGSNRAPANCLRDGLRFRHAG
jgi:hypothetical protein